MCDSAMWLFQPAGISRLRSCFLDCRQNPHSSLVTTSFYKRLRGNMGGQVFFFCNLNGQLCGNVVYKLENNGFMGHVWN